MRLRPMAALSPSTIRRGQLSPLPAVTPGCGWALLDGAEVWRTAGGDGWALVARLGDLRGHCLAITRAGTLVGTSQARLLRVTESGFEDLTAFERAPGRDSWYTPWGDPPDTRSIAEDGDAVYVNVHVGGIPRSRDLGDSWLPTATASTRFPTGASRCSPQPTGACSSPMTRAHRGPSWRPRSLTFAACCLRPDRRLPWTRGVSPSR